MSSSIDKYNGSYKELISNRLKILQGETGESIKGLFDDAAAMSEGNDIARQLERALVSVHKDGSWQEPLNLIREHTTLRAITNGGAYYRASLKRNKKLLAGLNTTKAISIDGGLLDLAMRGYNE